MSELNNKIITATKWSMITELISKLVSPVTTMVLARLLTPDAFGVVATITMIISFAEIFTDAGFQKFIMQHDFDTEEDKIKSVSVAFTTNLIMSLVLWLLIIIFSSPISRIVGNPGLGHVISIACASIPLAAFSSIQTALFKRDFDFRTLFIVRLICALVPICVTIPLALIYKNYWALICGTLTGNIIQSILLTYRSKIKPRICIDLTRLKKMFSFCGWTIVDSVLSWCTWYADIFFVGILLNEYYLGLYKTSMSTVSHIMNVVYSSIFPVVIPALARLQDDRPKLNTMLLKFQKVTSIVILPIGVIIFLFQDLITKFLLGNQWSEAAPFIGLWALIDVFVVVFTRFPGSAFVAIGKPKISVIDNFLHIIVLIPAIYIAARYDFQALYYTRTLVRIEGIIVSLILSVYFLRLSATKMIVNILPEVCASLAMSFCAWGLLKISSNNWICVFWILCALLVYVFVLSLFKNDRLLLVKIYNHIVTTFLRKVKSRR